MTKYAIRPGLFALRRAGCCAAFLMGSPSAAQPIFTDITHRIEVGRSLTAARSIAWGDSDNDGFPDLFLSGNLTDDSYPRLLRNMGDGGFAERTAAVQTAVTPLPKGGGSIFGDYDNDGDLDFYVPVGQ